MHLTNEQREQLEANGYDVDDFLEEMDNQPSWLKYMGEIDSIAEMKAIQQGGCASGAYMPAVTYHTALDTMSLYGDEITEYLIDNLGELPTTRQPQSWSQLAVFYASYAVELWVSQFNLDDVDWD